MELDVTYNEDEQREALRYSIRVEARGEEESRSTESNMERNGSEVRRVAGWQSQTTIGAAAANRSR